MKELRGNLITLAQRGDFDVIIHGCNCFNTMGAGVAKQIRHQYPIAYAVDSQTESGDLNKLGNYTSVKVGHLTIVNAYTQYGYHPSVMTVDYNALRSVFKQIKRDFAGQRIGFPKIGAGLAGGNWDHIATIIDEELNGEDYTVVVYKP